MADNDEIISTLNDLIEVSKDGEEGFRSSAEHVDEPQLKTFFLRRSHEVATSVQELQDLVRALGGGSPPHPPVWAVPYTDAGLPLKPH